MNNDYSGFHLKKRRTEMNNDYSGFHLKKRRTTFEMNNNDYSGLELQESDGFIDVEDDTGNLRHGFVTGDFRNEFSGGDTTVGNLCSVPSTSGNNSRKKKSKCSSYPYLRKVSRFRNLRHPARQGGFFPLLIQERIPNKSTFRNVVTSDKEKIIQPGVTHYPKRYAVKSAMLFKGDKDYSKDISFGITDNTCAASMSAEFKFHNPEETLKEIYKTPYPSCAANYSDIEICKQFGIYKCKCGLWFSSQINFDQHCSSCSSQKQT